MPHQCHGHSHGTHNGSTTADLFTNANTIIGGATSFLSMLFFVARAIDTFSHSEEKFAGMSYPAMAAGFIIALYAAVGSTISHRALNKGNQETESHHHAAPDQVATHTESERADERSNDPQEALLHPHATNTKTLTNWQRLILLGDFIGHASDVASPILFMMLFAFEMEQYQKGILYAGCFGLGLFGSVASVRTCRNALLTANQTAENSVDTHEQDAHDHAHHCHGHGHSHA